MTTEPPALPEPHLLGSETDDGLHHYTTDQLRAYAAAAVAAERERLRAIADKRASHETAATAHYAGRWHVAFDWHVTRHAAMRDLMDAVFGGQDQKGQG